MKNPSQNPQNPQKQQIVYKVLRKVVRPSGIKYYSASYDYNKWRLQYIPEQWIFPQRGFIYVFDTFENANRFKWLMWNMEVWKAETDWTSKPDKIAEGNYTEIDNYLNDLHTIMVPPPKGTLACKKLRLLEKMQ